MGAAPGRANDDLAEFDGAAEVDAVATTQRRSAIGYSALFLVVMAAGPALTVLLPWWTEARLPGGLSPSFLTAAVGLYVFFVALAVAATTLAAATEDRMLGDAADLAPPGDTERDRGAGPHGP